MVSHLLSLFDRSQLAYHVFDTLINRGLVPTRYYELAKEIEMPETMFCRQINISLINKNHKLAGTYLEELTSELTARRMFSNIIYLNESNEWIPFDLDRLEQFFFLDMKCFRIKIDQAYHRNQFHFSAERRVLKVNFNFSGISKAHKRKKLFIS